MVEGRQNRLSRGHDQAGEEQGEEEQAVQRPAEEGERGSGGRGGSTMRKGTGSSTDGEVVR